MTAPDAGPALAPCPFCGGTAVHFVEGTTYRWCVCVCSGCGANTGDVRKRDRTKAADHPVNVAEPLKEWLTRAPSPAQAAELAALREENAAMQHDIGRLQDALTVEVNESALMRPIASRAATLLALLPEMVPGRVKDAMDALAAALAKVPK